MSHLPLDVSEDSLFHHGLEPRFGLGLSPSDFRSNLIVPRAGGHHLPTGYRRPWSVAREALQEIAKLQKKDHFGEDGFQACVDVHHFQPFEITVKTVGNTVIVEGRHEERRDSQGTVERYFVRKYNMPKEYDMSSVRSSLSSDGVLTVTAPPPAAAERHISIAHVNMPAHLALKDNKPNDAKH